MTIKSLLKYYNGLGICILIPDESYNKFYNAIKSVASKATICSYDSVDYNQHYDIIYCENIIQYNGIKERVKDQPLFYVFGENIQIKMKNALCIPYNYFLCCNDIDSKDKTMYPAIFCGLLSVILEAYPIDYEIFVRKFFYLKELTDRKNLVNRAKTKYDSVLLPISHNYLFDNIRNNIKKEDIVGYYDYNIGGFCDFSGNLITTDDFEKILVANDSFENTIEIDFLKKYMKDIIYLDQISNDESIIIKGNISRKIIDIPIVLIGSFFPECSKFECQVNIHQQLEENGYKVASETNNPWGYLFDFNVVKYREKVVFPDDVYKINNSIFKISYNKDICIKNIGGGLFFLNNTHHNFYGAAFDANIKAFSTDIFILCVNRFVQIEMIEYAISYLNLNGITKIIIVSSDVQIEPSTFERKGDFSYFHTNKIAYNEFTLKLKDLFRDYSIFNINDVRQGLLTEKIIEVLT